MHVDCRRIRRLLLSHSRFAQVVLHSEVGQRQSHVQIANFAGDPVQVFKTQFHFGQQVRRQQGADLSVHSQSHLEQRWVFHLEGGGLKQNEFPCAFDDAVRHFLQIRALAPLDFEAKLGHFAVRLRLNPAANLVLVF